MAIKFEYGLMRRVVDRILIWMLRYDIAPAHYYLLTTIGRKSGLPRSKPVALVEEDGQRWLVAPYGEVHWVHNARVTNQVSLSRGRVKEHFKISQLPHSESAPILKKYVSLYAVTRPYFDAQPESELGEFEKEAHLHPVFQLQKLPAD